MTEGRHTLWTCQDESCANQGGDVLLMDRGGALDSLDPTCPRCQGDMEPHSHFYPATDLEQLREALRELVEAEVAAPINCGCRGCADKAVALSHARDLLDPK